MCTDISYQAVYSVTQYIQLRNNLNPSLHEGLLSNAHHGIPRGHYNKEAGLGFIDMRATSYKGPTEGYERVCIIGS